MVIRDYVVDGNKRTKNWLIISQTGYQVGDTLATDKLEEIADEIEVNVGNLQLFARVTVTPVPLPHGGLTMLIEVRERWYIYPAPVIKLAEPNLNVWWENRRNSRTNYGFKLRHYNFRGRKEKLSLIFKFGYTRDIDIKYESPFLIRDSKWGASLTARFKEAEEITVGTVDNERIFYQGNQKDTQTERGLSLGTSYRPNLYNQHDFAIGYADVRMADSLFIQYPEQLIADRSHMQGLELYYRFSDSRVDRRGYPLDGQQSYISAKKYGIGVFANSPDVLEIKAQYKRYIPLGNHWYSQHALSAKSSIYSGLPYYLQEGLGYQESSVRSYEYYIMDGQHYMLLRNNLKYGLLKDTQVPMFQPIRRYFPDVSFAMYLNLIADFGYVWDDLYARENALNNSLLMGTGLGLDIVTNYDVMLRAEFTVNRLGEPGFYMHFRKSI